MELSNTASANASPPIEGNQAWIGFQQLRFSGGRRTAISWRGDGRKPATRHHWFANNRPPSRPPRRSVSKCVAASKIVVDVVVPLVPPKVSVVQLPQEGSAALEAKAILAADLKFVSAFHHVGAAKLHAGGEVDCDVLVFPEDEAARNLVLTLAEASGMRGINGGVLANAEGREYHACRGRVSWPGDDAGPVAGYRV